ncbi:MAG TPA: ferrous iron transport protein B, partial [Armatimonadetes bacterium]|nr:ferrous iron transport protein B [Armatimonadota bacterium]
MEFRLALVGNPNVGKSTIFNILTGLHQHVGNWPGKTVEKKEGVCHFDGRTYYLIDLPGTYSLTANSIEEIIARDYIVQERPDVVIAIVDASNLERNLYLVTELLELTPKVIVALNMLDLAQSKGYEIEVEKLQAALGVPVVPVIAVRAQGIRELLETAAQVAQGEIVPQPASIDYEMIVGPLRQVEEVLQTVPSLDGYPRRWVALKLLEGDGEAQRLAERVLGEKALARLTEVQKRTEDAAFHLAHARYAWIEEKLKATLKRPPRSIITLTDRLDHLFTHRFLGLPILLSLFGVIFGLTFTLAAPLQDWIDAGFNRLSEGVRTLLAFAPTWLTDLLTEGVIAGVGSVLTFFPVLIIFFFFLALLEDSGYLARAAFVMDRLMHLLGLHGKTFLSLLIAYGCNIPGIMATRILEEERDR